MLSALEIFLGYALYKFTFYLLTLLTSHEALGSSQEENGARGCVMEVWVS